MKVSTSRLKHPKGGYYTYVPLDNTKIFKRDYWAEPDRFGRLFDYGVYLQIDESYNEYVELPYIKPIKGRLLYIGRGVIEQNRWLSARALNHKDDLMSENMNDNTCIYMIGCGMTYDESSALEACWIKASGKELSKRGSKIWDKKKLINKRREKRWELKGKNILLPYGDNTRFTA